MATSQRLDIDGEIVRMVRTSPGIALADVAAALLIAYTESHTRGRVRELAARGVLEIERAGGRVFLRIPREADA